MLSSENLRENPSLLSGLHLSRGVVPAPLSLPTPPYPRDGLQTRCRWCSSWVAGPFWERVPGVQWSFDSWHQEKKKLRGREKLGMLEKLDRGLGLGISGGLVLPF